MAGRPRNTRNRIPEKQAAHRTTPTTLPLFPSPEEISICDALARFCPGLDQCEIFQHLREDETRRRERVDGLRQQVLAGTYNVSPRAVAAAILLEGDLLVQ